MKPSPASGAPALPPRFFARTAIVSLALAGYALILLTNTSFAVGGSDSSGYFNASRMFLNGRLSEPVRAVKALNLPQEQIRVGIPLGYVPAATPGEMGSIYPIGYPLHLAAASIPRIDILPFFISPLAAIVAVILTFALGREVGMSQIGALCAAAAMAVCPVLVFQGVQQMSDAVALVWSLAAVLLALKSSRRGGAAFLSGLAFGIGWLVRPTSVLLIPPLAVALLAGGSEAREGQTSRASGSQFRRLQNVALFAAGAAPFLVLTLLYNNAAFGSWRTSGYSIAGLESGFSGAEFGARFRHYLSWTSHQFTPLALVFWCALAAVSAVAKHARLVLLSWFGSFFFFFCFYTSWDAWWYTRFLLPAYPALVVGAFLFLERVGRWTSHRRQWALVTFAILIIVTAILMICRLDVLSIDNEQHRNSAAARWLARSVSPDALVVSMEMSGSINWYSGLVPVRWDWLEETQIDELAEVAWQNNRPVVALLMPHEVTAANERFPDRFVGKPIPDSFTFAVLDHSPEGYVDTVVGTQVSGWAFDRNLIRDGIEHPSSVRVVLKRDDGAELRGPWQAADLPRNDLIANGPVRQETHAFILDIAPLNPLEGSYEVSVEARNEPAGLPVTLTGTHAFRMPPAP